MTTTEALRMQVKDYVDHADEKTLRMLQAILEIGRNDDFWNHLPDAVREDVHIALEQSANGAGKTHEEMIKKYTPWLTK